MELSDDVKLCVNDIKLYVDDMESKITSLQDIKIYDYMPYIICSILVKMLPSNIEIVKQINKKLDDIQKIIYENGIYKFKKDIITPYKYKNLFMYYHDIINPYDIIYINEFDNKLSEYTIDYNVKPFTERNIHKNIKQNYNPSMPEQRPTPDIYPKETKNIQELKMSENRTQYDKLVHSSIPKIIIDFEYPKNIAFPDDLQDYKVLPIDPVKNPKHFAYKYPNYITIDDNRYEFSRILSNGSFGIVCLYQYGIWQISIKIVKNETSSDIQIAETLKRCKSCMDYIINFVVITHPEIEQQYILMEYYNGDVFDLKKVLGKYFTINEKLKLIIHIINACICFKKCNLYYTDLKSINLLYKFMSINTFSIVFGDIGSFTFKEAKHFDTTFNFPMDYLDVNKDAKTENTDYIKIIGIEIYVVYTILYLFINLLDINISTTPSSIPQTKLNIKQSIDRLPDSKIKTFLLANMPIQDVIMPTTFEELLTKFEELVKTINQ